MTDIPADQGRVDAAGRLQAADARLAALNARAGGAVGALVAVPSLAMLAHLAATLKMPVSRIVLAADGDRDVELQVQARPDGDGVALDIGGWTPRAPRSSWLVADWKRPVTGGEADADWTWATDAALRVTAASFVPGEEMTAASGIVGQPLTRLVRLVENEEGNLPILAALATASSFSGQRAVRRDRPDAEIELSGEACRDAAGNFTGFEGRATALAPKAVALDDLPAATTGADFAERLGKALRAPLDRIVARADTISAQADGPLRRDYADYAGDIGSAARHLLALVDDLADLEAVERSEFAIAGEPVDLADVARRAAGLLGVRAADKQVRIDRPDVDEVLTARGDFRRVLQILVNLLTNAVRYTPSGGMVWLRTEQDGDSAVVVVADQGKGIAPEDHARVFDKFERVDPSEPGGSGLGLYISRRLARAMGGDITLDSAPGQGARFVLTLPVV
ncbi:sensor histidine kinase KdpD [Sphingomonas sp. SUN039]|uniref:sensor histidine kinase n=1 Tax=Sphingomonas sp. SUN039 TaxID=2937787 RepID=UPI002164D36C|nr:HAMP domain-containing sensor histidine kinase [Sphingomonas sp. SUN039]UVO53182.1 HAMP domain-containing histidine kinase [Sphingomonas sp. SUN039]